MPRLSTPTTSVTLATLLKHLAFLQQFRGRIIEASPSNHCSESPNPMLGCVWNFQGERAGRPLESNDVGGTPTLLEEKKVRTKVPQPSPAIQPPIG